jgi:hypothetical protein
VAHNTTATLKQDSAKAFAKTLHSILLIAQLTDVLSNAHWGLSDSTTPQTPSVKPSAQKAMPTPPQEFVSPPVLCTQIHTDFSTKLAPNGFVSVDAPQASMPTLTLESATRPVFLLSMQTTGPIDVLTTVLIRLPMIIIESVWMFAIPTVIQVPITRLTSAF